MAQCGCPLPYCQETQVHVAMTADEISGTSHYDFRATSIAVVSGVVVVVYLLPQCPCNSSAYCIFL